MDKQKQIEEMAEILQRLYNAYGQFNAVWFQFNAVWFAEHLAVNNIGKIPEKAVVLTMEEWDKQQKDNKDFDEFARSISDIRLKNGNKIATLMEASKKGLIFDYINEGTKEQRELYGGLDTRKVYADIYLDDKAWGLGDVQFEMFMKRHEAKKYE